MTSGNNNQSIILTVKQAEVLRAAMNRIIPPDDFPGGWDAGAGDYLMRQLDGGDLAHFSEFYKNGLDALEDEARAAAGTDFAQMDAPAQDALLTRIEADDVTADWPVEPSIFFRRLVEHTMEGFYGDPGNGGNREEVSWKMIGFEVRG